MSNFTPMGLNQLFGETVSYQRLTCAELVAGNFKTNYLIEGVLAEAQPCIVGGPKKALKTSFLIDLAIAVATAGSFLGRFCVCSPQRVAVMSGESGLGTLQETALRIARSVHLDLVQVNNLLWTTQLPKLGQSSHMAGLDRFLRDDEIKMLVVDPAYLCMPSAESGNLFAQGELLASITAVCQARGATLLLAHHTKKGRKSPFDVPELDDLSWSGFAEFARQWLLLGRREQYEPGTGDHRLWLSVGGSAGHSGLYAVDVAEGKYDGVTPRKWQVKVKSADEARAQKKAESSLRSLERDKVKLLSAARRYPTGETKTIVFADAQLSGTKGNPALEALVADGFIALGSIVKNGRKHDAIIPSSLN